MQALLHGSSIRTNSGTANLAPPCTYTTTRAMIIRAESRPHALSIAKVWRLLAIKLAHGISTNLSASGFNRGGRGSPQEDAPAHAPLQPYAAPMQHDQRSCCSCQNRRPDGHQCTWRTSRTSSGARASPRRDSQPKMRMGHHA